MRGVWLLSALVVVVAAVIGVCGVAAPPPEHGWSRPLAEDSVTALPAPDVPTAQPSDSATTASVGVAGSGRLAASTSDRVSRGWSTAVAARTGIPERAMRAYAGAALAVQRDDPHCGLGWATLAGLGSIESGHGTHGGSAIGEDGAARPPIFGPQLDGGIRAEGPLQFIPSTWAQWGADANGDGVADPQNIDDAALAAAHYLCSYGDLADPSRWRAAVFGYNHLDSYVDGVLERVNAYASAAR